ncbi:MAG: Bsp6I family type II restriction endonuclease [Chitinophagales bacterium]|nr:Bsp6I family type II restriction endonuclease [Chitinophagales bacterium]
MQIRQLHATVFGESCTLEVMDFAEEDRKEWKKIFDQWKNLKVGLKGYKAREPNFPEGLSEVAFCLWSGSSRFISAKGLSNTSFDTFNPATNRAEQIKACSVKNDLTTFGPKSKWDDLYFLDFYNNGKIDGYFDVYKIPNKIIYGHMVNKTQTLEDQQKQGRRPRFSIKKHLVNEMGIQPIAQDVKIW